MPEQNTQISDLDRSEENIDRLCKMVTYQKILASILVVQLLVNTFADFQSSHGGLVSVEFIDNGFVILLIFTAYVSMMVCNIVVTVRLSRMLNKTSLTVLYGILSAIFIVNVIPFVVLCIQVNRKLNKYGINTDHFLVTQHKIRSHFRM